MTDEQIIESLRCCQNGLCKACPNENCTDDLFELTLDFINRQKEKIERLEEKNADKERAYTAEYCLRKELKTEIERLNVEVKAIRGAANSYKLDNERLLRQIKELKNILEKVPTNAYDLQVEASEKLEKQIKTEAIKEFAERLKQNIKESIGLYWDEIAGSYYLAEDVINDIDTLVEEMTEVQKWK